MRGSTGLGKPSPSMIVAIVALIVALGGTSYAAVQLSANSVGTKQIRNKAVTTPKVKNNAITAAKVRNAAVTRAKIANGAVNGAKIANSSVGAGKLAAIPAARAIADAIQPVPDFTSTTLNLDSSDFDSGGIFDAAEKAMIVPRNGVYQLSASIGWAPNATGVRQLRIVVDNKTLISSVSTGAAATGTRQNASGALRLQAGQKVSVVLFQNSGVQLNTQISAPQQAGWLSVAWLGN